MSKVKSVLLYVWHRAYLKYLLVCIVGVAMVGFLGENSVLSHLKNKHRIATLEEEIQEYEDRYASDMRQIRELDHNPKAMERIARERYFMKTDDEDIFVLSDDNREPNTLLTEDEKVE